MIATAKYTFSAFDYLRAPELEGVTFLNSNKFLHSRTWNDHLRHLFFLGPDDRVHAKCTFTIHNNTARSPYRATYGCIECSDEIEASDMDEFVGSCVNYLKEQGCTSIHIIQPPAHFDTQRHEIAKSALTNHSFQLRFEDQDQYIPVSEEIFESMLKPGQVGKIRKCEKEGLQFVELDASALDQIYSLLEQTLGRKDVAVSMSLADLKSMFREHPKHYLAFGVIHQANLVAAAVSLRITPHILHNLYHGADYEYANFSPTTMLIKGIYNYGGQRGYEKLDLGISSVDGVRNEGLFRFKASLGAIQSEKLTWELQL